MVARILDCNKEPLPSAGAELRALETRPARNAVFGRLGFVDLDLWAGRFIRRPNLDCLAVALFVGQRDTAAPFLAKKPTCYRQHRACPQLRASSPAAGLVRAGFPCRPYPRSGCQTRLRSRRTACILRCM